MQVLFGIEPVAFGVIGIFSAAAIVFFAFIGFDIVATAAEETIEPQHDVPRGIIGSLAICTVLYVAVSLVVVGMQKYSQLSEAAPLSDAFISVGQPWLATIISVGAIAGLTTVVLVLLLGQTRVLFAMCRDGLLPRSLAVVHPTFGTPARLTIIIGLVTMALAGFVSFGELAELVNIGTLFAFVVVSLGGDHPAADATRPAAGLPRAAGALAADPVGAGLPLPDAQPAGADVAAVPGLDGHRDRALLRLRLPAQQDRGGPLALLG
ncbi:hypothetical protein GCM10020001_016200 [Nonomuraea salmonea]